MTTIGQTMPGRLRPRWTAFSADRITAQAHVKRHYREIDRDDKITGAPATDPRPFPRIPRDFVATMLDSQLALSVMSPPST